MIVFIFEVLSILIFIKLADLTRAREFLPVVITGTLLRFLEHTIFKDWLGFWQIHPQWLSHLFPISADLTLWPVVCYLFMQYLPHKNKFLYITLWVGLMLSYLQILMSSHVLTMHRGWNLGISAAVIFIYFGLIYLVWYWLHQKYISSATACTQESR